MLYTLIFNLLKNVFRPLPDMRYKFLLKNELVSDSLDNVLFPFNLKSDINIEIEVEGKIIKLLSFEKTDNRISLCGLPLIANMNMTINIIDTIDNECLNSYKYNKGEFINYDNIFTENKLI
jgi:hypothetical protein